MHQAAHGFVIQENQIEDFLRKTDEIFKNEKNEFVYKCDYIFTKDDIDETILMDVAYLNSIWASAPMEEPLIGLKHIYVEPSDVVVMKEKHIKIMINGVACIKFFATDLINELKSSGGVIDAVGKASLNEWMGQQSGQILLDEVEIISKPVQENVEEEYIF